MGSAVLNMDIGLGAGTGVVGLWAETGVGRCGGERVIGSVVGSG